MRISVVVPAYNEEACLSATLEKIATAANTAGIKVEVIVVNNDSTDKTAEIAKHADARVILETVHNISKVRNTGANAATGEVLVFIDADTLVQLFARIDQLMLVQECFGGAVSVNYGKFQRRWMRLYSLGWNFWGKDFNMRGGAAQFCRKSVFQKLGGYDETLFMGEDVDFYWRLTKFAKSKGGYLSFIEDLKTQLRRAGSTR